MGCTFCGKEFAHFSTEVSGKSDDKEEDILICERVHHMQEHEFVKGIIDLIRLCFGEDNIAALLTDHRQVGWRNKYPQYWQYMFQETGRWIEYGHQHLRQITHVVFKQKKYVATCLRVLASTTEKDVKFSNEKLKTCTIFDPFEQSRVGDCFGGLLAETMKWRYRLNIRVVVLDSIAFDIVNDRAIFLTSTGKIIGSSHKAVMRRIENDKCSIFISYMCGPPIPAKSTK